MQGTAETIDRGVCPQSGGAAAGDARARVARAPGVPSSHHPGEAHARRPRSDARLAAIVAVSLVVYAAVLAGLAWPWLRDARDAIPRSRGTPFVYADDARFIVFVLGWVAHALGSEPTALYQAPIYHPAPSQLAGSEHFLSSQVVAAPVFWATGNAVLAANAATFASYPVAAAAAELLLLEMGAAIGPAWIAGLLFALGPLRVPANLQLLQYTNLFLPLIAWALLRMRRRPSRAASALLFAVVVAGALSSYHMAAMLGVVGVVWLGLECLRREPGRARFVMRAAATAAAALAVVAVVSIPYFIRPEARDAQLLGTLGIRQPSPLSETLYWFATLVPLLVGVPVLALSALGLPVALARRAPVARRLALWGAALVLAGAVLMLPPEPVRALIDGSPLRFLRAPWRFIAIVGLGTALLAAAFLEWARGLRRRPLAVLVLAGAAAIAIAHGSRLVENGVDVVPAIALDRGIYEAVGRVAATQGAGPLLELPGRDAAGEGVRSDVPRARTDPDAMVGVTLHGQPLITGRTGYPPAHTRMIDEMIDRLPSPVALQELVDATHLRWLLLRPEGYWADFTARQRLLALDGVETVLERDGWVLARVDLAPGRTEWFDAIRARAPGRSPFGTPLAPLDPAAAGAEVAVVGLPPAIRSRSFVPIDVEVRNVGGATWPVMSYAGTRLGVFLAAQWQPVVGEAPPAGQAFTLPRDVAPGESVRQRVYLKAPRVAATYDLEMLVKQWNGSRFESPASRPFRARIAVADGAAPVTAGVAAPVAEVAGEAAGVER